MMTFTSARRCPALWFIATLFVTPAVFAHAHLEHQYPAANAQVDAAPQALTLNFSEGIEAQFSGLTLTGPGDTAIETGKAKRNEKDKKQLIVPLSQPLQTGDYRVEWHVVSVDGHKTKGHYLFSVR